MAKSESEEEYVNYFDVQNTQELEFLVEKFGDSFSTDEIIQKLQETFDTELQDNYFTLYEKNNDELTDEEKNFLEEIRFGASMLVEEELDEELEELQASKAKNNKRRIQ